jgi:DNA-binding response OmpR family regulator
MEREMSLIAVIDDDPDILETTELILSSNDYKVISADNPDSGFKMITDNTPDLIILDVMMDEPDDGFFLAQKLRRAGISTPILMYTSISKAVGMEFGKSEMVPVDEFVEKPISSKELLLKVSELLNNKGE